MSSSYGSSGWAPYALSLDAVTTCSTRGARRTASSTAHVPAMLASNVLAGLRLATPTWLCAARWKTVRTSYSLSIRSTSAWSFTSPRTAVTSSCHAHRTGGTSSRTSTTTRAPRARSWGVRCDPRNPVAPVSATGRSRQKPSSGCHTGPSLAWPPDTIVGVCGVVGVVAPDQHVSNLAYLALYALQHRGQEAAGMAVSDGVQLTIVKAQGLVASAFDDRTLATLEGNLAIGHTRYSTTGASTWRNAQPVYREVAGRQFALGHNGNLTNTAELV